MLYSLCSMQFCINKSNLVCAHLCPAFILKFTGRCGDPKKAFKQQLCRKLLPSCISPLKFKTGNYNRGYDTVT